MAEVSFGAVELEIMMEAPPKIGMLWWVSLDV
jgi:hypothetical protein